MTNNKENIKQQLLVIARDIVSTKGADFLTARKLSEASGFSIGSIYNNFDSMDELVAEQNQQTLHELLCTLNQMLKTKNHYQNINNYLELFVDFVIDNQNLWFLFYNFHFNNHHKLRFTYRKLLLSITNFAKDDMQAMFPQMDNKRLKISFTALILTIFAQSHLLTVNILNHTKSINNHNFCKLLLNTYLAGMMMLNKD